MSLPRRGKRSLIDWIRRSRAVSGLQGAGSSLRLPALQAPNRWYSIQLRQYAQSRDVWLDADEKHVHVPAKLGLLLKIKLHRPLEGTPKTAHLVFRTDGNWYALIACEPVEEKQANEDGQPCPPS